jgi:hypothetical protein
MIILVSATITQVIKFSQCVSIKNIQQDLAKENKHSELKSLTLPKKWKNRKTTHASRNSKKY